ncbi:hypothetical protein A2242_03410 [Candidatus Falkowbacteria bacterium RIFOXYA2_FULL_47_9]|uniref:Uncharacterized protein n=1 Tax=Candidatus Falkowbacteria bacterium RIFOXYA2_FULL_47_9 TaxID=1797995 RepID=A0A1F5SS31_9BACT|nr:MAG: hypothetical protein A2242_03410 [Candidatus Falkowbacteria bacterium RIFOXYA2_FULL_47_9]
MYAPVTVTLTVVTVINENGEYPRILPHSSFVYGPPLHWNEPKEKFWAPVKLVCCEGLPFNWEDILAGIPFGNCPDNTILTVQFCPAPGFQTLKLKDKFWNVVPDGGVKSPAIAVIAKNKKNTATIFFIVLLLFVFIDFKSIFFVMFGYLLKLDSSRKINR